MVPCVANAVWPYAIVMYCAGYNCAWLARAVVPQVAVMQPWEHEQNVTSHCATGQRLAITSEHRRETDGIRSGSGEDLAESVVGICCMLLVEL